MSPSQHDALADARFPALLAIVGLCLYWINVAYLHDGFGYPDPWIDWLPAFTNIAFSLAAVGFWRIRVHSRYYWSFACMVLILAIYTFGDVSRAMHSQGDLNVFFSQGIRASRLPFPFSLLLLAWFAHAVAWLADRRGERALVKRLTKTRNWVLFCFAAFLVMIPVVFLVNSKDVQVLVFAGWMGGCLLPLHFHLYMSLATLAFPAREPAAEQPSLHGS